MIPELIFLISLVFLLTGIGGGVLFSEKGLDEMYKLGIWKDQSKLFVEKESRRMDRFYGGGGLFMVGFTIIFGLVVGFYFKYFY